MLVGFFIALAIAVLSGLGVGGGGLFAVYLSVCTNTPQLSVQGFNLVFFLFCAGASVAVQIFRRKIPFAAVGVLALAGLITAPIGIYVATLVPQQLLRKIFGIMLVAGGIISLRSSMKK